MQVILQNHTVGEIDSTVPIYIKIIQKQIANCKINTRL